MSKYIIAILGIFLAITAFFLFQSFHKISVFQEKVKELENKRGDLEAKLKNTEDEKSELESKSKNSNNEKSELESKLINTENEKSQLEAKLRNTENEKGKLENRLSAFENKQKASVTINEEFVVDAGKVYTYTFSPSTIPGILFGSWESSGKGYGGYDDTIAAFRFTDPKDNLLQSSSGQSKENFFAQITFPGTYTFFFDNVGPLRSTPRRVFLKFEYRPN